MGYGGLYLECSSSCIVFYSGIIEWCGCVYNYSMLINLIAVAMTCAELVIMNFF